KALGFVPPTPSGLPRLVPPSRANLAGIFLPENVSQRSLFSSQAILQFPNEYHPERFPGDPGFASDRVDILLPFSMETRNCTGRSLDTTLFPSKMRLNFGLRLAENSKNWIEDNEVETLWSRTDPNGY
ncbi:hypothetical protein BJ170DRAFT_586103, partial [Xylariales sp. AK1849]